MLVRAIRLCIPMYIFYRITPSIPKSLSKKLLQIYHHTNIQHQIQVVLQKELYEWTMKFSINQFCREDNDVASDVPEPVLNMDLGGFGMSRKYVWVQSKKRSHAQQGSKKPGLQILTHYLASYHI